MSQRALLARMDRRIHGGMRAKGMADLGQYTAPGADTAVDARVYVDRGTVTLGEFQQVASGAVEVLYVLEDVTPAAGGRLVVDGDTYINVETVPEDDTGARWIVRRG